MAERVREKGEHGRIPRIRAGLACLLALLALGTLAPASSTGFEDPPAVESIEVLERRAHDLMRQDPPDFAGARMWFERAALQGSPRAASYMGWFYENGQGVQRDHAMAARWYAEAAVAGAHDFALKLGWMYLGGSQLEPDRGLAEYWFRQAIDAGYHSAHIALASVLIADAVGGKDIQRVSEARELLETALENDHRLAAFFLARLYVEGVGGHPVDAELGARYARISAEDGQAQMQGWLARMYLEGHGIEADRTEAAFWAMLAAASGDPLGERIHQVLVLSLSEEEIHALVDRAMRWSTGEAGGLH
jgi:uncharacterized protein